MNQAGTDSNLLYEQVDGIGVITINRPHRMNAIDIATRNELRRLLENLGADRTLKVLILSGAGGNFCSGGDVKDMSAVAEAGSENIEARRQRMLNLHPIVHMLVNFDRPVIAAVQGVAAGAGFGLALTADLILAATNARFCAAFGRVGAVPDLGTFYTLPRVVGLQRAKELVFSAREVDAQEALQLGIALELHPPEQLMARAFAMATAMANASGTVLSISKRALNQSLRSDLQTMLNLEAEGAAIALNTEFHTDAAKRFANKQPPKFRWPRKDET